MVGNLFGTCGVLKKVIGGTGVASEGSSIKVYSMGAGDKMDREKARSEIFLYCYDFGII